ncbi:MAG: DUF2085 domain-containing protein [Candidatus Bathyarchaeota archaeon]|nr:DUF2085 domain-containing protein [Candidatus Bathyarchaeota archaeon]
MSIADELARLFDFFGSLVCHQLRERTLFIGGRYLPVCARDTGAFLGLLIGYMLVFAFRRKEAKGPPNLYMILGMTLPLVLDGFGQALGFWASTNDVRLFTGFLFGAALAPMLVYALSLSSLKDMAVVKRFIPQDAVLDDEMSWLSAKALSLGVVISMALFAAVRLLDGSENEFFYWIISTPIVSGIIAHFFILPVLLCSAYIKKLLSRH